MGNGSSAICLTTPWLLPNNDCIEIFIESIGDRFYLTDAGEAYNYLLLSGIDLAAPEQKRKRQIAQRHVENFHARFDGHEIVIESSQENVGQAITHLVETIKNVSATAYLQRPVAQSGFKHKVFALLASNRAKVERDYSVPGFGKVQTFDFRMNGHDEALIRSISSASPTETQSKIERAIFSVNDALLMGRKFNPYVIYDDTDAERKDAWQGKHLEQLIKYNVTAYGYSQDRAGIEALAASHR